MADENKIEGCHGDVVCRHAPLAPGRVFRYLLAALGLLLIALVLGAVFAQSSNVIQNGHWLRAAVSGRMFLACAAVMVGCLMGLLVLSRALWLAGAAHRSKGVSPQGGAVIVEFAMVLPFVLVFVMIMVQSMLMMAGYLCVHYAAFCAARAAVVQVPTDLSLVNPIERPNYIDTSLLEDSPKVSRIRAAAVWPLIPVSCGSDDYPITRDCADLQKGLTAYYDSFPQGTAGADTHGWVTTQLPHRISYAWDYTHVTLEPSISGVAGGETHYGDHEDLVVDVDYTFYLSFPFMAKIFKTIGHGVDLPFGEGNYGLEIKAKCQLPNEGVQDFVEPDKF
jgi:hypothetical protein